jgi:hypothetical protein
MQVAREEVGEWDTPSSARDFDRFVPPCGVKGFPAAFPDSLDETRQCDRRSWPRD